MAFEFLNLRFLVSGLLHMALDGEAPAEETPQGVGGDAAQPAKSEDSGDSGAPFGLPVKGGEDLGGGRDEEIEEVLNCVYNVFLAFSNSDSTMFSTLVDNNCR